METGNKVVSDGGSSSYYDIAVPEWLAKELFSRYVEGSCFIKTEELIEVLFGNDFNFGTTFKSTIRARAETLGGGKAGNTLEYELNKIRYYVDRIEETSKRLQDKE